MSADPKAPEPGRAPPIPAAEPHRFEGRLDRWCLKCNLPDRDPIHVWGGRMLTAAEAVNAEPPATPEPAPNDPLITGHFDVPRLEVRISESGAMGAAPMPRVSDDQLQGAIGAAERGMYFGDVEVRGLLYDLRDSRSREAAGRAKVAELEARIAALTESRDHERRLKGDLHDIVNRIRSEREQEQREARAALARANEALRAARFQAFDEALDVLDSEHIDGTEHEMRAIGERLRELRDGAQGSAAQKPEPRDAG